MLNRVFRAAIVSVAMAVAAVGSAQARIGGAHEDEPREDAAPPAAEGVTQAVTAAQLADWGRRNQDPGALIMAARLLAEVPMRAADGDIPVVSPGSLLDEAAALSNGDPDILDVIQLLREQGVRGVHNSPFGQGPIFTVKEVRARETFGFDIEARGGEVLRVAAIGDGDTNIDMSLTGTDGALLCRDGYGDHYPVCTVAPRAQSTIRVEIVNRGDVWTRVQILSN